MGQEPKSDAEIKEFAALYNVKFLMFSKIQVNGDNANDIFKFLRFNSDLYDKKKDMIKEIPWNFTKFLVDREGKVCGYFGPNENGEKVCEKIEALLKD